MGWPDIPQPFRGQAPRPTPGNTAAALKGGLANDQFWDGKESVRALTWLHVSAAIGFLAITLDITAKALTGAGSPYLGWWWAAIVLGGVTVALVVGYLCLDAFDVRPAGLRRFAVLLLVPAVAALISSGVFAWLQPAGPAAQAADLPGMTSVIGWTSLAIAVALATALISMLLGLRGSKGTLTGGSWVTLVLAFSLLNSVMLGALVWLAHLVGPVTSSTTAATAGPR